jgi:hypothetical protein
MNAAELLGHAERMLDGHSGLDGQSARLAAFLARQSLEQIIAQRCANLAVEVPYANARSKLIVLRSLDTIGAADRATWAWNRLSNACHIHAYEMAPSTEEIRQLCATVASLLP